MSVAHVVPVGDPFAHDTGDDGQCPCGPEIDRIPAAIEDGWIVIHYSLDGREVD